jgi:hypothetical protein
MRKVIGVVILVALAAAGWWWKAGAVAPAPAAVPTGNTATVKPDPSWASFFDGLAAQWEAEAKEINKQKAQKPGGQKR